MSPWLYIFIYAIVAYNLSFWLVYKDGPFNLFKGIRRVVYMISPSFAKVFECMNCTPTWIGLILSGLNLLFLPNNPLTPFSMISVGELPWFVIMALDAVFTSGIVYLIDVIETRINRQNEE